MASPARRLRRLAGLLAALTLSLSALALVTGSGTAHAQSGCPIYLEGKNVGGSYFCNTIDYWDMPNNYQEYFVIAPDHTVWTIWDSSSGVGSWKSMGGQCDPSGGLSLNWVGIWYPGFNITPWDIDLYCQALNGSGTWYRQRNDTGNGSGWWYDWAPWTGP